METAVLTAIISAVVSLIVALITVLVSRSTIKAEREKLERELDRTMTVKLYDIRMKVYPKAVEVTEGLRKSYLSKEENLTEDYIKNILTQLDAWHATEAGFILSRNSLNQLYALRKVLREKPESNGRYSPAQINKIWEIKGKFRAALWADIQLLFKEDVGDIPDD